MQSAGDEHETAFRELNETGVSGGVGVISQLLPFQASARVIQRFDVSTSLPTARQNVAFTQDTPLRSLVSVWAGAGVGCTLQVLPSHAAASGSWALAAGLKEDPTATQAVAPVQSTSSNAPFPDGFGDIWTAQKAALVFPAGAADAGGTDSALVVNSPVSKKQITLILRMRE